MTFDGKGMVMVPEDLRPATKKAVRKLATRLTKGEKRNRKRLSKPWEDGSVGRTMHATLYVAMCARLGRSERALEVIASTLDAVQRSDERWLEPEIHRLRAEILRSHHDAAGAERSIATAIEKAKEQGSRSLELRATSALQLVVLRAAADERWLDAGQPLVRSLAGRSRPQGWVFG